MVALPSKRRFSVEEYLEYELTADVRHEYWDGEIVAMSGGSRSHNRTLRNLVRHLAVRLGDGPCEWFSSETRVRVSACNVYFYPDVVITCGETEYEPTEAETVLNPTAVFEVLSRRTEAVDRGAKFDCYRELASLKYYVLVSQLAPGVDLYTRETDGRWVLTPLRGMDAVMELSAVGLALPFAELYRHVEFPARLSIAGDEE